MVRGTVAGVGPRAADDMGSASMKALLAQVVIGLRTLADASDRLPDIEVAAYAYYVAERLELGVEAVLDEALTDEHLVAIMDAVAGLRGLLATRGSPQEIDLRKARIRRLARERWAGASGLKIDAGADVVEDRHYGAYVNAWVWVPFTGTSLDPRGRS